MASSKNTGDYTVGARGILHIPSQDFLIDHIIRGQMSPAKAEAVFKVTCQQDLRQFPELSFGMEEEPGSSGKYSIRHFQEILNSVTSGRVLVAETSASK